MPVSRLPFVIGPFVSLLIGASIAHSDIMVEFGTNTETITQVVINVIDENDNSFAFTQNAPQTSTTIEAKTAVLDTITLDDGTVLDDFSFQSPTIVNPVFSDSGDIEVFANGTVFDLNDSDFLSALSSVHSNGDLASYIRVDGSNSDSGWDLQYSQAIDTSGYLIVEERNGNTDFSVTALDINGNATGETLLFDDPSYQWDTAIQNFLDPNNNVQTQELSVIDFNLFGVTADVYGFEVVNTGNADFKFSFANSSTSAIPEPGTVALLLGLFIPFGFSRRRSSVK